MTHPAEQQPPAPASGPDNPGPGHPTPPPVYATPGAAYPPGYAPPGYPPPGYAPPGYPPPGYPPPPGGYPGPRTAVPGYGYPPGGIHRPGPVGPGGAPLAEFWQRLLAYLLDGLIVGAAVIVPLGVIVGVLLVPYFMSPDPAAPPDPTLIPLLEVLAFAVIVSLNLIASYVYFVRMCHRTGQTIGKRVMNIRVVRGSDGGPIDLRTARRRWVVQHATAVLPFYFNVADGLWQLWDQPYRQCLHDKCAETVVVQVTA